MQTPWLIWAMFVAFVYANTETHIIKVPNFFDVPPVTGNVPQSVKLRSLNASHIIASDYPIIDKYAYNSHKPAPIELRNIQDADKTHLLVRLDNYLDSNYDSNDLLFVKVCWPAIYPIGIDISHLFLDSKEVGLDSRLDMYLDIEVNADFKTFSHKHAVLDTVKFDIIVEKLPNRLPIPLEVYDIIVYLVDVAILLRQTMKFVGI